jgi:ribonucleotide monophosphatase NagD (HAD superfamily)
VLPGTGIGVAAVSCAAGRTPINCGKPERFLLDRLLERDASIEPRRTLMVGDRLDTDILFGQAAGFDTLLVMSGIATQQQLDGSSIQPTYRLSPGLSALFK